MFLRHSKKPDDQRNQTSSTSFTPDFKCIFLHFYQSKGGEWAVRKPVHEVTFHNVQVELHGKPPHGLCKSSGSKRRQAPRHPSPPGRNLTLSARGTPGVELIPPTLSGRRVRKGWRLLSLQAFYYVFPKTAVVQTDLTPCWKVCHQHSGPLNASPL